MTKIITESDVRRIAKEEVTLALKDIKNELRIVTKASEENRKILERLERLLLGEVGSDVNDTLKAKASFAYLYAKRNTDLKIIERAEPALKWFEDMSEIEPGCKESKLDSLGKLIGLYLNIKWMLAVIGLTTVINSLPILNQIIIWVQDKI